jgi:hypothetical protein
MNTEKEFNENERLKELAEKIVAFSWNKTNDDSKIAFILKVLHKEGTEGLYKITKSKPIYDIIKPFLKEFFELEKIESFRLYIIKDALRAASDTFNWHNYDALSQNGLFNYISDFDNNFRGDIIQIHKVGNHTIIETLNPFMRKGAAYYTVPSVNRQFSKLEHAMLYSILGETFSASAIELENAYTKYSAPSIELENAILSQKTKNNENGV